MRVSLSKYISLAFILISINLFSSSLDEAQRNFDLGYYVISEYLFQDLLDSGNHDTEVLIGFSSSLLYQEKFDQVIELNKNYQCNDARYYRNLAYSYYMLARYYPAYFYYNKASKQENHSDLDLLGRGWSAYYLGNAGLAYSDLELLKSKNDTLSLGYLEDNWKSNSLFLSSTKTSDSYNLNFSYTWIKTQYSLGINWNHNSGDDNKRDLISLQTAYNYKKLTFKLASFSAKGDFKKLYDGYGLSLQSSYIIPSVYFHNNLSLMTGYSYYESLSAQEIRANYLLDFSKFDIACGVSYLYLDYITPDYDKEKFLYHANLIYSPNYNMSLSYNLTFGESNFAYNKYLMPYDNYDIEKIKQALTCLLNLNKYTLLIGYANEDYARDAYSLGFGYVF